MNLVQPWSKKKKKKKKGKNGNHSLAEISGYVMHLFNNIRSWKAHIYHFLCDTVFAELCSAFCFMEANFRNQSYNHQFCRRMGWDSWTSKSWSCYMFWYWKGKICRNILRNYLTLYGNRKENCSCVKQGPLQKSLVF